MVRKKLPKLLKAIVVLFFIYAAFLLFGGIFITLGSLIFAGPLGALVGFVYTIVPGVLYFFLGIGLWKFKKWARYTAIVLSFVMFVLSLFGYDSLALTLFTPFSLVFALLSLSLMVQVFLVISYSVSLVHLLIALYLIFSNDVKSRFK